MHRLRNDEKSLVLDLDLKDVISLTEVVSLIHLIELFLRSQTDEVPAFICKTHRARNHVRLHENDLKDRICKLIRFTNKYDLIIVCRLDLKVHPQHIREALFN